MFPALSYDTTALYFLCYLLLGLRIERCGCPIAITLSVRLSVHKFISRR